MQRGVVDLDGGVLDLEGHHVEDVLQLRRLRHQQPAMVQPWADIAGTCPGHVRPRVAPAVAEHLAVTRDQHGLASGVGDTAQQPRVHGLAVLVEADRRLDLAAVVDRLAGDVAINRVKGRTAQLATVADVEERVVVGDVREAFVPIFLFNAAQLLTLHVRDDLGGVVGKHVGWRHLAQRLVHVLGQQLVTQAGIDARPTIIADPAKKGTAVEVLAMAVITTKRPVEGLVARPDLVVGVLRMVRTDDAHPALGVDVRQHQPLIVQPLQDAVLAGVAQAEADGSGRVGLGWRHAKRGADLRQGELAFGVKGHEP